MAELTWQSILKSQQQDFIKRLEFCHDLGNYSNDFIHFNTLTDIDISGVPIAGFNSEIIELCYCDEHEKHINNFCWKLVNKYDDEDSDIYWYENPEVYSDLDDDEQDNSYRKDKYINYKIGTIGEEAVSVYLGNLVTAVNYKMYDYGDEKIDFLLNKNKNIEIQVKTRVLRRITCKEYVENDLDEDIFYDFQSPEPLKEAQKIIWEINSEESQKNKILICVLFLNPIATDAICETTYRCLMAGFIPIESKSYPQSFKMNELLYMGGIRAYLESL